LLVVIKGKPMKIPLEYGKYYHIFNRGNNREDIFKKDEDYQHFFKVMSLPHTPSFQQIQLCLYKI
jgi:putative transposase